MKEVSIERQEWQYILGKIQWVMEDMDLASKGAEFNIKVHKSQNPQYVIKKVKELNNLFRYEWNKIK